MSEAASTQALIAAKDKRIADLTKRLKRVCRAANDRLAQSIRITVRQALREIELRRREAALQSQETPGSADTQEQK